MKTGATPGCPRRKECVECVTANPPLHVSAQKRMRAPLAFKRRRECYVGVKSVGVKQA